MDTLIELNDWIGRNQPLLASVAIPLITLIVTLSVNSFSNARASKDRILQREMTRKIKIADFRRDWIDELRSELAEVVQLSGSDFISKSSELSGSKHVFELYALVSKIEMRLNPEDENYDLLRRDLELCTKASSTEEIAFAHAGIVTNGRKVLKTEWEKLKSEMRSIDDGNIE
jgi:hypothetical protein